MAKGPEFLGLGQFVWWIGVVEYRNDPAYLGRVKVRIFGWHPENKSEMATQDLPWAQVMTPTTSASKDGIGHSPNGLQVGSWVVGWFMDGADGQFPLVIGTLPGIHKTEEVRKSLPGGGAAGPPKDKKPAGAGGAGANPESGTTYGGGEGDTSVPKAANYAGKTGDLGGRGENLTTIYAQSGAKFTVNSGVAGNFQGFINDLEATGYYIDPAQSAGFNNREKASGGVSEHAFGNAIDINWDRNKGVWGGGSDLPPDVAKIADKNGLTWGGNWSSKDDMHFEYNPAHDVPPAPSIDQLQAKDYSSPNNLDAANDPPPDPATDTTTTDQNQQQQSQDQPDAGDMERNYTDQHSTHPLARNANTEFQTNKNQEVDRQNKDRLTDLPLAGSPERWAEPHSADAPGNPYPMKQVFGTESGFAVEYDDRKGAERYKIRHPNGTYTEIDAGGNIVQKAKGDTISISQGNSRSYAKGDHSMTAQGGMHIMSASGNINMEAKGAIVQKAGTNWNIEAKGSLTFVATDELVLQAGAVKIVTTSGSVDIKSAAEFNAEATGEMNLQTGASMSLESASFMSAKAHGDLHVQSDNAARLQSGSDMDLKSGAALRQQSGGDFHIRSGGDFFEEAATGNFHNDRSLFGQIESEIVPFTPVPVGPGSSPAGAADAKAAAEYMQMRQKAVAGDSRESGAGGQGTAASAQAQPVNPAPEGRDQTQPPPEAERTMSPRPTSNDPVGADTPQNGASDQQNGQGDNTNTDTNTNTGDGQNDGNTTQPNSELAPPPVNTNGPSVEGKGSWFNPTSVDGGAVPYTDAQGQVWNDAQGQREGPPVSGLSNDTPGIAINDRGTMGDYYLLTDPNGRSVVVRNFDMGPAGYTGVAIDVNAAAASALGYSPNNGPGGFGWSAQHIGSSLPDGYNVGDVFENGSQISAGTPAQSGGGNSGGTNGSGSGATNAGGSGGTFGGGGGSGGAGGGGGGGGFSPPSYLGGPGGGGGGGGFGSAFGSAFSGNNNGTVPLNFGGWNAGGILNALSQSGIMNGMGQISSLGGNMLGSLQGVVQMLGAGEKGAAAIAAISALGSAGASPEGLQSAIAGIIGGHAGMGKAAGLLQMVDQGMRVMRSQGHSPTVAESIVTKLGPEFAAIWGQAMASGKGNKTPVWLAKHDNPMWNKLVNQGPELSRWGPKSKQFWKSKGHSGDISLNAYVEWWNSTYFRNYPSVGRSSWTQLKAFGDST